MGTRGFPIKIVRVVLVFPIYFTERRRCVFVIPASRSGRPGFQSLAILGDQFC